MINNVKILRSELLSDDKYILKKITYEYVKEDGSRHEKVNEVYDRGNAAAILLYNKEQNTVILTKQFRLPSFINGNQSGMLVEACAGMLDGDSPEDCAKREAEEETGYKVSEVKKIFDAYMSPGSITEIIHFFIGNYTKDMKVNGGGGVEDEEENIDVMEIGFQEAVDMMEAGKILDAKTIILLQYVKLHELR